MDDLDMLRRLAVSLAIGLLIGIERGWAMLSEAEGERTAGLRTLALTGLLGGVVGLIAVKVEGGAVVLALSFLAYAAIFAAFRYREVEHRKTYGTTTIIAALLTFALGALAILVEPIVASAAAVAAASLLALKPLLHNWLRRLTWEELRAGLVLLAMSIILLPVLPDRGFGPLGALNPYDLWRMTVLIAAVSSLGYLAMKVFDGTHGIALSGMAGGLVSSTATTLSFSRLAREQPAKEAVLSAGALLAGAVMMARILVVAGTINPAMLRWLLLPLGFAGLAIAGLAAFYMKNGRNAEMENGIALKSPFELGEVLKFGAFLAVIMVAAKVVTAFAGDQGAYVLAAVSGIGDVDALTLSMSRLAADGLDAMVASIAVLIAAAVNTVSKAAMGWVAGGPGPGRRLFTGAAFALLAGLAGLAIAVVWDPMQFYNTLPAAR